MPPKPTKGSITQTADAMQDRANNISNVSSAINRMQKDVDQKIAQTREEVKDDKQIQQIHNNMNQTLSKLNQTIGAITTGVGKITADTAKATAGAINQYGKAISDDISFNKKSVVAMALAKTSPIYGYFVAKFMETNVWKQALTKMRTSIMQTMGAILRPFKGGAARGDKVPHAQTGGYIGQSGLAKVHAGETITPSGGGGMGGVGLQELISIQREQLSYMEKTFGMQQRFYKGSLVMRVIRKFRRTRGNYVAQLSTEERPLINIAENLATLYSGLMWRLDNMFLVTKAQAEAARDLSSHVTGTRYEPIPGIRLRSLVRPLVRKLVGGAIKAIPALGMLGAGAMGGAGGALGMAGIAGLMLGKKGLAVRERKRRAEAEARGEEYRPGIGGFLSKRRGAYANYKEPGFIEGIKSRFGKMFPGRRELEGGMVGGGGVGGSGGSMFSGRRLTSKQRRRLIRVSRQNAIGLSRTLGGSQGRKKPIWVTAKPGRLEKFTSKKTKLIEDNTKKLVKEQTRTRKAAEGIGMWMKIMGMLSAAWGFIKTPFTWLANGISSLLGSATLRSALGGAIGSLMTPLLGMGAKSLWLRVLGPIGAGIAGWEFGGWINENFIEPMLNAWYDKWTKASREATSETEGFLEKHRKQASGEIPASPSQAYHSKVIVATRKHMESKALVTGAVRAPEVINAQLKVVAARQHIYGKYGAEQVKALREQWHTTSYYKMQWALRPNSANPAEWGRNKELAFIKYLEDKGQVIDIHSSIRAHQRSLASAGKIKTPTAPPRETIADKQTRAYNDALQEIRSRGYGQVPATRMLDNIVSGLKKDVLTNPARLLQVTKRTMDYFEKAKRREQGRMKFQGGFAAKAAEFADSLTGPVKPTTEQEVKKAGMITDPIVKGLEEVKGAVIDTGKKQQGGIKIESTSVSNAPTSITNSEQSSTTVGGGGGNFGSLPPDHLMGLNVYGRGR